MYTKFDTIAEAYTHLQATGQSRQLWTIAWTGGKYFVFKSSDNPQQQMGKLVRLVHDHTHARMSSTAFQTYVPLNKDLARMLRRFNVVHEDSGHAEEDMIRHFRTCVTDAMASFGQMPTTVVILNSDSPCTTRDPHPSDTLIAWPVSCTEKLKTLAATYPGFRFRVLYYKRYRGRTEAEIDAAFAGLANMTIEPYPQPMREIAERYLR